MRERLEFDVQYENILRAAITLSDSKSYYNVTSKNIADHLYISKSNIFHYFNTMGDLRNAVIIRAVEEQNYKIIAQAISCGDSLVKNIDSDLKVKALESLI